MFKLCLVWQASLLSAKSIQFHVVVLVIGLDPEIHLLTSVFLNLCKLKENGILSAPTDNCFTRKISCTINDFLSLQSKCWYQAAREEALKLKLPSQQASCWKGSCWVLPACLLPLLCPAMLCSLLFLFDLLLFLCLFFCISSLWRMQPGGAGALLKEAKQARHGAFRRCL